MKRILLIFIAVWLSSCDNLSNFNANPKGATKVPAGTLLLNAQKNLSDALAEGDVNKNIFRLLSQQWTQTTYTDQSNYNLATRTNPQWWWHNMYRDVLKDLDEAKKILEADDRLFDAPKTTQIAITEILSVYTYATLINTFGDIPYTEALDFNNLEPKYDDAATVQNALITRLDVAMADLAAGDPGDFATFDALYNGDISSWLRFGNSIKLRLGMTLADFDPGKAKSVVESAAAGVFKSNTDNALFKYYSATPNTNPLWITFVQSERSDYVTANTIVDVMNNWNDPRRPMFFQLELNDSTFRGAVYGSLGNASTDFSLPGTFAYEETTPALLLDYAEVEFYLAEAVARGMSVGGTAAEHYNNGITASMEYWGVADTTITDYLTQPSVAYSSAQGDFKEKIGMQKWLALYNRGFDAWTEQRRLDYPVLTAPTAAVSGYPVRFTYPVSEQNVNTAQYNAASAAIGGDQVENRIFWDMQ